MYIKESVSKGFSVAVKNMNLVLLLFVVGAIWNVLNVLLTQQTPINAENPNIQASISIVAVGAVFMLVSIFMQGGSMGYVLNFIKTGQANFADFKANGKKFYSKILVLGLLVALIIGVLVIIAALAAVLLQKTAEVVGIVIALVAAAAAVYVAIMVFLSPYVIIVKNAGPMAAIKESRQLVVKNIWPVLGVASLLVLIGFGAGFVLGLLFGVASLALKGLTSQILFGILSSFINAFLGVAVTGSFMKLYLSLTTNTTGA